MCFSSIYCSVCFSLTFESWTQTFKYYLNPIINQIDLFNLFKFIKKYYKKHIIVKIYKQKLFSNITGLKLVKLSNFFVIFNEVWIELFCDYGKFHNTFLCWIFLVKNFIWNTKSTAVSLKVHNTFLSFHVSLSFHDTFLWLY